MIILATKFNQSYVHIISSTAKLIIDNVFHNVCFLLLTIVKNGCTYADVRKVVFRLSTDIFSAFHIPVIIFTRPFPRPTISSSKYFLRSNIILEYFFWYWYHILHCKDNVLSQNPAQSMKKLRLSSKKTVKRSIVNYTKMLFRTKGMTCNHTLRSRESFQPYSFMNFVL